MTKEFFEKLKNGYTEKEECCVCGKEIITVGLDSEDFTKAGKYYYCYDCEDDIPEEVEEYEETDADRRYNKWKEERI